MCPWHSTVVVGGGRPPLPPEPLPPVLLPPVLLPPVLLPPAPLPPTLLPPPELVSVPVEAEPPEFDEDPPSLPLQPKPSQLAAPATARSSEREANGRMVSLL